MKKSKKKAEGPKLAPPIVQPLLGLNYNEVMSTLNLLEGVQIQGVRNNHLFTELTGKMLKFVQDNAPPEGGKDGTG